jgi:hypothetical protein
MEGIDLPLLNGLPKKAPQNKIAYTHPVGNQQ